MDKKQFHTLLINYTSLTVEEAQLLISLEEKFPYSQVIHSLAARATQDHQLSEREDQLHLGAIYTTDRSVFKSIMTAAPKARKYETPEIIETEEFIKNDNKESTEIKNQGPDLAENGAIPAPQPLIESNPLKIDSTPIKLNDHITDESFYDEILKDLYKLKELKHEFEETVKQYEDGTLSASLEADKSHKKKNKQTEPSDELISEIKNSKKKVKPEGPKQKEQIEIIEQFIKTQPSIKGKVAAEDKTLPKDDLSEKSLTYNENIISETLALILIQQGKKEKAIEVLKKLIWKFPQKKAYFAAQIEDLKK